MVTWQPSGGDLKWTNWTKVLPWWPDVMVFRELLLARHTRRRGGRLSLARGAINLGSRDE